MNAELLAQPGVRERLLQIVDGDRLERVGRCVNGCGRAHTPGPKRLCDSCRAENRKQSRQRYNDRRREAA